MSRRRRRWLLALAILAIVTAAAVAWRGPLSRLLLRSTVAWGLERVPRDPSVDAVLCAAPPKGPALILVVGSDSRDRLPDAAGVEFGPLTGRRADLLALVAVDDDSGVVRWLDVPRDLRVRSLDYGPLVVAEMLGYGGRDALIRSLTAELGVEPHHYLEVDFAGLAELVDAVGGVDVEFSHPARDIESGLFVRAGVQRLDGRGALAFARSRNYEERHHIYWLSVEESPDARRLRQERLMTALLDRLRTRAGPLQLWRLARVAPDAVVADTRLGSGLGSELVRGARSAVFEFRGLPTEPLWSDEEQRSPFGGYFGGRLYLLLGNEAMPTIDWLIGETAGEPCTPAVHR